MNLATVAVILGLAGTNSMSLQPIVTTRHSNRIECNILPAEIEQLYPNGYFNICTQRQSSDELKYTNPEVSLCFGLQIIGTKLCNKKLSLDKILGENSMGTTVCDRFQDMKLEPTLSNKEDFEHYNKIFESKKNCEKVCVDFDRHVNPLCQAIFVARMLEKQLETDTKNALDISSVEATKLKQREDQKPPGEFNNTGDGQHAVGNSNKSLSKKISNTSDVTNIINQTLPSSGNIYQNSQAAENEEITVHQPPNAIPTGALENKSEQPVPLDLQKSEISLLEENPPNQNIKPKKESIATTKNGAADQKVEEDITTSKLNKSSKVDKLNSEGEIHALNETLKLSSPLGAQKVASKPPVSPPEPNEVPITERTNHKSSTSTSSPHVAKQTKTVVENSTNGIQKPSDDRSMGMLQNEVNNDAISGGPENNSKLDVTDTVDNSKTDVPNNPVINNAQRKQEVSTETNEKQEDPNDSQDTFTGEGDFESTNTGFNNEAENVPFNSGESLNTPSSSISGKELFEIPSAIGNKDNSLPSLPYGTPVIHSEKLDADEDSHFFAYFMTMMVLCIVGYLIFHNKQKILALALEGRARRGRRRPNTSGYRKLDSNLEEAISSSRNISVTQVIY